MLQVSWLDGAAILFFLVCTYVGLRRGLTKEFAGVVTILVVAGVAVYAYLPLAAWLETRTGFGRDTVKPLALIMLVVASFLAVLLLRLLTSRVVTIQFVSWLDRVGGAVAGALSAALFVLLMFVIANNLPPARWNAPFGERSWIGRTVLRYRADLIRAIDERVQRTREALRKARESRAGEREKWE